ncbi:MAG TPA: discoidin domain-containing protein, partial [Streptomyces sp.]
VDGNAGTYWESNSNAFPQNLTVDLGSAQSVGKVTLKLPPSTDWATRTETLAVQGSTDNSTWSTLKGSGGVTFNPSSGNTATLTFTAATARYVRLNITGNDGWPAGQIAEFEVYAADGTPPTTAPPTTPPPTTPPAGTDLAQGRPVSDTGHTDVYTAANTVDGNANSYWESTDNAFPQSLTVDLGAARTVGRLVLKLPPSWGARTQTLSVLGSADNSTYTTLKSSAGYTFDPASGDSVTVTLTPSSTRYLRLTFTANTGWPAGQLSELEAYGS